MEWWSCWCGAERRGDIGKLWAWVDIQMEGQLSEMQQVDRSRFAGRSG